jgi:drug/metabolite transporter (DMT)-like permease
MGKRLDRTPLFRVIAHSKRRTIKICCPVEACGRWQRCCLDFITISLMLLAGLLHASWHSIVKSGDSQITTLAGMGIVAATTAAVAIPFVPFPSISVWVIIALSVVLHVGYKICLSRAYEVGDLGQAFPLARGMVPLFATSLALLTLGQAPNVLQWCGVGLVSAGIIALVLDRIEGRTHWGLLAAAAGAGMTVAGYSVLDAYGTRLMGDWLAFAVWLVILDSVVFLALAAALRGNRLWTGLAATKARILVSGLLGLASFSVFLWALSRNPVGAVSALRETSVLFAGMIGVFLHQEKLNACRGAGAILVVVGIVIIAF